MAINDDFTVSVDGNIRHASGATHYTVLQLHRFLQDLADDAYSSGDDLVDITSTTPSERSTDNIITLLGSYNIDDTAAEYFYAGSVKQGTGGTEKIYSGLKVLGAVNNTNTQLQIIQNNVLYDATPFWGTQSTGGYNGDAASGVLMRCLVKTRSDGADIDGKRIRVQARHWGDTFDFFNVTLGEGESVAAIGTTPDAQNTTSQGTVTAYTHVTNIEGYQSIDLSNGNGTQPYYSRWSYGIDTSANRLKGVWEFIKDLNRTGTVKTIHGLNGELFLGITHQWAYDSEASGPFQEDEIISWGSGVTAGTAKLLALNDAGTVGTMWVQLLTGVAPSSSAPIVGLTSNATAAVNGSVISRTIPKIFLGSYTGSLIGAFGIGVLAADLVVTDSVQDLYGVTQIPPNIVTFTVSGLVSGHDYVLVGPKATGNAFATDQLTLNTTLSGASETSVVVTSPIPSDTPSTGTIRIILNSGLNRRVVYTSWANSTFTISPLSFTGVNIATSGNNLWVSYIDRLADDTMEAFSTIYNTSRSLYVRVRDGGASPIKTFESPATLSSAGGSAVASRITDL